MIRIFCPMHPPPPPPPPGSPSPKGRLDLCDPLTQPSIEINLNPDPVYAKHNVDPSLAHDLQIMSVIDELAKQLSPNISGIVQNTVREAVKNDKRFAKGAFVEF